MNKIDWYEKIAEKINFSEENLESFYGYMYKESVLSKIGADYRLEPCPNPDCGHKDCCTIGRSNSLHCFSCGTSGTHINAYLQYASTLGIRKFEAIHEIEIWSGIPYPKVSSPEEQASLDHYARLQEIRQKAVEFYHKKLFSCETSFNCKAVNNITSLDYQLRVRKHDAEVLRDFKVMFSSIPEDGYFLLWNQLLVLGYEAAEIKEAKVKFPDDVFVYPYFNPITGDIVRFNIKNPFGTLARDKDGKTILDKDGNPKVLAGMSTDNKALGFAPKFNFTKPAIVVEGENDAITVYESGFTNICWTGGNLKEDQLNVLERLTDKLYTAYDNDDAGRKYYLLTQAKFPHKDVRRLDFDTNDIDDYYKKGDSPTSIAELVDKAKFEYTDGYQITHVDTKHWSIQNRLKKLDFKIDEKNKNQVLCGTINTWVCEGDDMKFDIRIQGKSLLQCPTKMRPFNYYLDDAINKFFNEDLEERGLDELINIYHLSSHRAKIIRCLAQYMFKATGGDADNVINKLKVSLDTDVVDSVLKEVNNIQNSTLGDILTKSIPRMRLSEYFNIENNDAYMYFNRLKQDGDTLRRLPFLLRNDGTAIRLDLFKRKDPQCLLLIDNKYELPFEVPEAVMDDKQCSLQQHWADKFIKGEVTDEELNPSLLIKTIEGYIRRFFWIKESEANITYKLIALFIYSTYFYELFKQTSYLLVNGDKGSGKSTLDSVLDMFCLNAKFTVDISEASLFRMISFIGGTFILDEMENLTSRTKSADSTMATVLKAGYSDTGGATYRHNVEKNVTEPFQVYCPKVISNIFGIEDVIGDRCIEVKSFRYTGGTTLTEDPKLVRVNKENEIKEITSKLSLSALMHYKQVYKIYTDPQNKFATYSPRTHQLISPLLAIARWVDMYAAGLQSEPDLEFHKMQGEFELALKMYHDTKIVPARQAMDSTTPEWIIKQAVPMIAQELMGIIDSRDKQYTHGANHKYTEPIEYSIEEGWFDINTVHFKCFIEESMPGEVAKAREVNKWVKSQYDVDMSKRKMINIERSEELVKEFGGNTKPRVSVFRFYFRDYIKSTFSTDVPKPIKSLTPSEIESKFF